jgi:hypothetical protein
VRTKVPQALDERVFPGDEEIAVGQALWGLG